MNSKGALSGLCTAKAAHLSLQVQFQANPCTDIASFSYLFAMLKLAKISGLSPSAAQ